MVYIQILSCYSRVYIQIHIAYSRVYIQIHTAYSRVYIQIHTAYSRVYIQIHTTYSRAGVIAYTPQMQISVDGVKPHELTKWLHMYRSYINIYLTLENIGPLENDRYTDYTGRYVYNQNDSNKERLCGTEMERYWLKRIQQM